MKPPKEEEADNIEVDGGLNEQGSQFCYLGNIIDSECGLQRARGTRVLTAWKSEEILQNC